MEKFLSENLKKIADTTGEFLSYTKYLFSSASSGRGSGVITRARKRAG